MGRDLHRGGIITTANVCAVVVTFDPDAAFPTRLERILPQVGAVIIVDNGSAEPARVMLNRLAGEPLVSLIYNGENLGIARALNIGIAAASPRFNWALLLDDDTEVDAGMVEHLCSIHNCYPDAHRLAVIGAGFTGMGNQSLKLGGDGGDGGDDRWQDVQSVITSGSLLSLSAREDIGPFREEFFIDYVDVDYCLRARAKGYRVVKSRQSLMSHAIGSPRLHRLLWMKKWTTHHSSDRRYYMARNDTALLRQYGNLVWGLWALKSLGRCLRSCKRIILYEDAKADKIGAVFQGWCHAIIGKFGPRRPPPLA